MQRNTVELVQVPGETFKTVLPFGSTINRWPELFDGKEEFRLDDFAILIPIHFLSCNPAVSLIALCDSARQHACRSKQSGAFFGVTCMYILIDCCALLFIVFYFAMRDVGI
jgi:hypothetical protein